MMHTIIWEMLLKIYLAFKNYSVDDVNKMESCEIVKNRVL